MTTTSKLDFIQALRGVAVLMVVFAHSRMYLPDGPAYQDVFNHLIWGGGGVDLFFVISGFIMVYTTRDSDGSIAYTRWFAIKRLAKIWPPYVIFTIIWVFAGRTGFPYFSSDTGHLIRSLLFLPMNASNPMYFGSEATTLQVGWTLNFEAYFYVIFGISLLFDRWRWIALSVPIVVMLVLVPLFLGTLTLDPLQPSNMRSAYLSMMANPLIWDFVAGIVIGQIYLSSFTIKSTAFLWLAFMVCVAIYLWNFAFGIGGNNGMARWGAYSAVSLVCLALISKTRQIHPPQWLVSIGNVSYTLYLSHLFAFFIITDILIRSGHKDQARTVANQIATVSAALILAFLTGPIVERLLHDFILSRFRRPKRAQAILIEPSLEER